MAKWGFLGMGSTFASHRMRAVAALAVAAALFGAGVASSAENQSIFIRTGSGTTLKAAFPVAQMSSENASIVAASLPNGADKTEVLLTAKAAGATTVTLHGEAAGAAATYNVIVLNLLPEDVRELIKSFPGLEVKGTPAGVIIEGVVFSKKDKDQIDALCAQRSHDIIDLVGYDPVHPLLLKRIRELIGTPSVRVAASGDSVLLAGTAENDETKKRAEDLAKSLADKVLDDIAIQPQQIELDCVFISADRDWRKNLGVNLLGNPISVGASAVSDLAGGQGQTSFLGNTSYHITANGGAVISFLEQDSRNKVLCKPHLTVVSGKPAEVLSGGEIGLRLGSNDVKYLPFGLSMRILPILDAEGNVQSDVMFELSSIPTRSETGAADISQMAFRVSTTVRCKLNETIIYTGLKDTRADTVEDRTPILGYIPLISYLGFRHTRTVERENEVLVCITPYLSKSVSIPAAGARGAEESKKLLQREQREE
jgi:Flp pilus assembly secretin CpaC